MSKRRPKPPPNLINNVLYKCARTCCVCRHRGAPIEVHHIDEDPENNTETNLIALCRNCHGEAHTTHSLSQNLDRTRLLVFKTKWEANVAESSARAMLPASNISQAMWTYVNHQRLPYVLPAMGCQFDVTELQLLMRRGVVNEAGLPIFKKEGCGTGLNTIYDHFEYDDASRLHHLYASAVDRLILEHPPIELGAIWTKAKMRSLLKIGDLAFCLRGFSFKSDEDAQGEEDRPVHAKARGIEVRFVANTGHMYGSSALYNAFSGTRVTAVLMLIRQILEENGALIVTATPLAMGAGFAPHDYKTPHHLLYGWATGYPRIVASRSDQLEL